MTNRKIAVVVVLLISMMFLLAFASVPLYRLFCQITGYGGTTQQAEVADIPDKIYDRELEITFNVAVADDLDWKFESQQKSIKLRVGENKLAFFTAINTSNSELSGTAIYNATPDKVGRYISKVQCFCFDKQTLQAGEKMEFPVSFYVDPAIMGDDDLDDVRKVTLSYVFYKNDEE